MVVYNYSGKEINAKIVYYGPALSGKTTNLEWIYSKIPLEYSGKMISLRTQTDRTIFFDFLPLELGLIDGFKTRFMLYTVPGQVYYNATRKMVLKGVDGVVFVADSEQGRMQDNLDSLQNLRENLVEIGLDLDTLPLVMQWNKRDLPNCVAVDEMEQQLNPNCVPSFESSALTGEGVYETLHRISKMIYRRLTTGDEAAAQARPPEREEETSLFGADIAQRLQQLDVPAEALEPVAVAPGGNEGVQSDGAVLDAILGAVRPGTPNAGQTPGGGGPPAAPQRPAPAQPERVAPAANGRGTPLRGPGAAVTRPTTAQGAQTTPGAGHGATPPPPRTPPSAPPGSPATPGAAAPRTIPAPGRVSGAVATATSQTRPTHPIPARPAEEGAAQKLVSDLVDNVLVPMDPHAAAPEAGFAAEGSRPQQDDGLTYGSSYGRMVTLDGKDAAAGAAPRSPAAPAGLPPGASTIAAEPLSPVPPAEPPLGLITDPRKLRSESASANAPAREASDSAELGFAGRVANAKIIEVPLTLDADALGDGKTVRIVLNLKLAR